MAAPRLKKSKLMPFGKVPFRALSSICLGACCMLALLWANVQFASAEERARAPVDYSRNPESFPRIYKPYLPTLVPDESLKNSASLTESVRDGKLRLSVAQLRQLVMDNNLDIVAASYIPRFADTDLLRTKGGGAPRGVPGIQIPGTLSSGAIGQGLGGPATLGTATFPGGVSASARQISVTARGSFDPTFLMNLSYDKVTSPLNSIKVSGLPIVSSWSTVLETRYVQTFTTGSSISLTFNNMRQSSTQQHLRFNPDLPSSLSFSFTQQIMNGFGFAANRRFQEVAKNDEKIALESYRLQQVTSLTQAEDAYWNLAAAYENVRVASTALSVAQQLYEDNVKQLELGHLAHLDVVQAESEVASRRRDLVVAQGNLQVAQVALKSFISKEIDNALGNVTIETSDPLPEPTESDIPRLKDALSQAMGARPEIRKAEGNLLNEGVTVRYARDILKPSLAIFGLLGSSGLAGDQTIPGPGGTLIVLPGGITQAFDQVRSFAYPEYAFGLSLSIPLRNRNAQSDNVRARLEERQAETVLDQTRNAAALEVRKAIIGLVQSKAQVEASHEAARLSAQSFAAEQAKLRAGASTPYNVIQTQRDLEIAQLAEVQALTGYAKALVEMNRSIGGPVPAK